VSSIDRGCYLFERYCDFGLAFKETHPNRLRNREVRYPYRPFREANLDHTLKFWELNFVHHKYWIDSLYKEAEELSNSCHERPLDASLFCQSIVVKTL
jgi:hypothetical protein